MCDFRPMANEMILNINFICGGFRSYTFVSDPAPIAHLPMRRDWAIEVLCPVDERNYSKMLASSRDKTLIPPYSRPLTVDDAVAIFPELIRIFPASYNNQHSHVHILKYVPEDYPVGSPRVVQFLIKEHSLFRKQHSCVT